MTTLKGEAMTSTITELQSGGFDVQDAQGNSLLVRTGGPFRSRKTAEATQRMLNLFDAVDKQIKQIKSEYQRYKIERAKEQST